MDDRTTNLGLFLKGKSAVLRLNGGYPQKVEITPSPDSLPPTWTTRKMFFVSNVSNPGFFNFLIPSIFDMRHEKTDLKVFVVVIAKEGWARMSNI